MKDTQFRILYRQFLFRMVDLELLSADAKGDMSKLFGQFAALLIFISFVLCIGAGLARAGLALEWSGVHFMIATTMLVVGLFAILSWDSTFPDRRDVMVLAPLPVRSRTIFFAKVAAVATALSVTIATLHFASGFIWPLALNHRHEAIVAPSIAYDAAVAPLRVAELEPVLRHDLEPALKGGLLAPGTGGGATVGVWKDGEQRVFAYGSAKPGSLFEIGSITKTFTALALAQLVVQGKARLDEPVRRLLPADTVRQQPGDREITLLDLATHRSGLPTWPNNLHPADTRNPLVFPEYGSAQLYEFLTSWGIARPRRPIFSYSNLGFAILGQALTNRAGVSYEDLLHGITQPLSMHDTVVDLSPHQRERLIQGYNALRAPVRAVELGALAPAGAIRSTAADMLLYLRANLHPETVVGADGLRAAIEEQHKLRAEIGPGVSIGLSWIYNDGTYWHNGATAGYTSYAFFNPARDYAVVVLTNIGPDLLGFAGVLGEHTRRRLTGERAISLNATVVPAGGGGVLDFLRVLAAWWATMLIAGGFIYCSVLGAQGLAAQLLPRRHFLRVSSWMQLAAFGIFVVAYFLEPKLMTPSDFAVEQNSTYLEWSPSYWFLGLFQQLNGSPALPELARRAWLAIAITFGGTAMVYTLAYFRTLRRIVEEPDIAPAAGGRSWLPRFGNGFATAVGQFSFRTILRSRQHRLLLAFYLGIGVAIAILLPKWPVMRELSEQAAGTWLDTVSLALLGSTTLIAILIVTGARVAFSLPTDLRANWIFRITPIPGGPGCMTARRRPLYALSVVPVCVGAAALLFSIWPWQAASKHLIVIVLTGTIAAELCLSGKQKLPFTCSYLPGKSHFNMKFLLCSLLFIFNVIAKVAQLERDSFDDAAGYAAVVGVLTALAICARWSATRLAKSEEGELQFEEAVEPAIFSLNLHRDGVTPIALSDGPAD
jgi:CubicO group peptidase (beta-lactamase class C family)